MAKHTIDDVVVTGPATGDASERRPGREGDPGTKEYKPPEQRYRTVADAAGRQVKSQLTRAGMEQAIKEGGSVLHDGRIITDASQLPSEAEVAGTNETARELARANIRAQRESLDKQEATLNQRPAEPLKK